MKDYKDYINNLKKQPLDIETKSYFSEIKKIVYEKKELFDFFSNIKIEIETFLNKSKLTIEELSEFIIKLKNLIPQLDKLMKNLTFLQKSMRTSSSLKKSIIDLEEYCTNNLSWDEVMKFTNDTENLKQQIEDQIKAFETLQATYMVNERLICFFEGVDNQFKLLLNNENLNLITVSTFIDLFNQFYKQMVELKLQISTVKLSCSDCVDINNYINYCQIDMTLQEVDNCLNKLQLLKEKKNKEILKCKEEQNFEIQQLLNTVKNFINFDNSIYETLKKLHSDSITSIINFCNNYIKCVNIQSENNAIEFLTLIKRFEELNWDGVEQINIGSNVRSFEFAKYFKNIQILHCHDNQNLTFLDFCAGFTCLKELYCYRTKIKNLKPLQNLCNIEKLICSDTEVTSLEPVKHLVNLEYFDCNKTLIDDLTPLKNLTKLNYLNTYDCSNLKRNKGTFYSHNIDELLHSL